MKSVINQGCLFLLDNLGVGGSERKTILAANRLAEKGLPVHMAFLNVSSDVSESLDKRIHYFSVNRQGKVDIKAVRKIRSYIVDNNIKTIWAVNLYPTLYMYLATRPFRNKVRLYGSSNITVFRNTYEKLKMLIYIPIIRQLDGFIFGSVQQMNLWRNKYFIPEAISDTIHNGVDINRFDIGRYREKCSEIRNKFGFRKDDIVIGMVAQFRPEKAYGDLIEAIVALHKDGYQVKLLLVGEGGERPEIERLVQSNALEEQVVFTGQLGDVRDALAVMDLFVLTSRAVETFSNAALEAMAMAKPVILSNLSGASEMVQEGYNGYLYPPGDVNALINMIRRVIDSDSLSVFGKNARSIVEEKFTSAIMAERYKCLIWPDSSCS